MKLFKKEGYNLTIADEALLLKPFKTIWKRDRTKGKDVAIQELGYVYFMEDPRSDYVSQFQDKEVRDEKIREGEGIPVDWKPDDKVKAAMQFYSGFKPASALLLEDIKNGISVMRSSLMSAESFADIDPDKRPKALDNYATTMSKLVALTKQVDELEKQLATAMVQDDKVRGSMEKSLLEDEDDD